MTTGRVRPAAPAKDKDMPDRLRRAVAGCRTALPGGLNPAGAGAVAGPTLPHQGRSASLRDRLRRPLTRETLRARYLAPCGQARKSTRQPASDPAPGSTRHDHHQVD
jgi:hypothetical protein